MKLIILDRDGVINEDSKNYIKSPEEWMPIHGSLESIGRLCRNDFRVVIVTNQSGIGRKLFSIESLNLIHKKMNHYLMRYGAIIDAIFFCPCVPEKKCSCRKPKPGLFNQVSERYGISLSNTYCVGDKITDIDAAITAGGIPVLVKTGKGGDAVSKGIIPKNVSIYKDLAAFVTHITTKK